MVGAQTYDSRRGLTHDKPVWRGWLHLIWLLLSLVAGTAVVVLAPAGSRVALAVYAASVSGLFGASALYHRGNWGARAHARLQRLDHVMIFGLIAGTSTPVYLQAVGGAAGRALCTLAWVLAIVAALTHLIWMAAPELLVGSTFVGLGLLGIAGLPAVFVRSGVAAFVLMLAGGVLYLLGALLYRCRWPDPSPERFGFHEVFHALVCAAATAQFVAIAVFVT